jgi:hypothetical protein
MRWAAAKDERPATARELEQDVLRATRKLFDVSDLAAEPFATHPSVEDREVNDRRIHAMICHLNLETAACRD